MPGLVDWLSLGDREVVRIANWHARLNVVALLIFVASFHLRHALSCSVLFLIEGGNER